MSARETESTALIEQTPAALQLSEQAIETTKHNIQLCEQLVKEVLERDIDFGTIPGVPQPFLWDSGAAKIMAAFNCYADYKVIDSIIQTPHIRYTIACHLISRQSQQIVATGIGAASTKEVKHRYRWVENPEAEGIARTGLKQRKDGRYRIPNPDTEDLLNTIAKMAAKRADVDAAQSLPGVAATLRKLFLSPPSQKFKTLPKPAQDRKPVAADSPKEQDKINWSWFWSQLNTLGIKPQEAHDILAVNSIKNDWIGVQHKTLDEAYDVIKNALDLGKAGKLVDEEFEKTHPPVSTKAAQDNLFSGDE